MMRNRMKYCFIIIGLMLNLSSMAQRVIGVDSDILFHETIDSLRGDFKTKVENRNRAVEQILNTKVVYLGHDTLDVFFPAERTIAFFLTGNYTALLADVTERFDYHYFSRAKDFQRPKHNFPTASEYKEELDMMAELNKDEDNIALKLNSAMLNDDERHFLRLYLASILAYNNLRSFDTEQMNRDCEFFLNSFPNSAYAEYVKKVMLIRLKTSNFGIGAGVFTGINFMGGNIGDYFRNYVSVGPSIELGYKRLLLKAEFAPSFSREPKQSFVYKNYSWSTDSTPFVINGNLNAALVVHENEKYRVATYAGIGSHRIHLTENAGPMVFRPNFNCGLEFDWKFAADNNYETYYETFKSVKDNTNWHIRFRLGYSQFKHSDSRFVGSLIYTKVEIGFYSNPARRIKGK